MSRFAGKVALVTGAGSGIGRAMAIRLGEEGAAVMCSDVDEQAAQATATRVEEASGRADAMGLDVSERDAVAGALEHTMSRLGGLDVLMNNAGIAASKSWDLTISINLSGVQYGLELACPIMAKQGGGAIVNTASVAGLLGLTRPSPPDEIPEQVEGLSAYVAAKHGVVGLTRQYAVTFARVGVRVNAVCPGYIETPMIEPAKKAVGGDKFLRSLHPIGRLGEPEEVAAAAAFLASEDASFINGVALPVDGGYSAR